MKVAVIGAGAFGTSLAIALARGGATVGLWARNPEHSAEIRTTRRNERRLPGVELPKTVSVHAEIGHFSGAEILLLAVPMQQLATVLAAHRSVFADHAVVACAKGIDLASGRGPTAIIAEHCPTAGVAVLTGPSFAADISRGLPTALTLACRDDTLGETLQEALSTPVLRLYRTNDVVGAELGGALKNVVAIAAGVVIGAKLGDSARAALMTRGFAEMNRFAQAFGARPETMAGLAGLGDLVLTCTSPQSRNFRYGLALGAGDAFDPNVTVEGVATAAAATALAKAQGIEMPITAMVAALVDHKITVADAAQALLTRPLRKE
jgi:glycerol-3-phosphate dehydrogenase (NAD(P)+)